MGVDNWSYWRKIEVFDEYLDNGVAEEYKDQPLAQDWARVAKVAEELGEAIAALISSTGQNPRKKIKGTTDELLNELSDIVNTAALAIQHFTKDAIITSQMVEQKLAHSLKRVGFL